VRWVPLEGVVKLRGQLRQHVPGAGPCSVSPIHRFVARRPQRFPPDPNPNRGIRVDGVLLLLGSGKPTPAYLPKVARLVAIGDLHGDIQKTRAAFRIAGLANSEGHWTGGTTTVVQVGDQLDRGGNEVAILYFLERMQAEAARAGGAVHWINGNHETLNVAARFRYATDEVRVHRCHF